VLIDVGGFLGMGERQVAVDMTSVRFISDEATPEDLSDYFLVTNASRVLVEAAPEYTNDAKMGEMDSTNTMATPATTKAPLMRDGYTSAAPADMTTEMLTGATVYGTNDETIGEVSQLNIDDSGKITEAIVDVGGFLGMGQKPVALKLSELNILRADGGDELRVYVDMSKEQMEALPTYSK
jgi:sporulation protein YlmC with PRC-barrel domain